MRNLIILTVLGALIGGGVGYLTKPKSETQIKLPGLEMNLTVESEKTISNDDRNYIFIAALIGLAVGAGIGVLTKSRRG